MISLIWFSIFRWYVSLCSYDITVSTLCLFLLGINNLLFGSTPPWLVAVVLDFWWLLLDLLLLGLSLLLLTSDGFPLVPDGFWWLSNGSYSFRWLASSYSLGLILGSDASIMSIYIQCLWYIQSIWSSISSYDLKISHNMSSSPSSRIW